MSDVDRRALFSREILTSLNIVTMVSSTMLALVRSVAVHSMKTSVVSKRIRLRWPLMTGGSDKTSPFESLITGYTCATRYGTCYARRTRRCITTSSSDLRDEKSSTGTGTIVRRQLPRISSHIQLLNTTRAARFEANIRQTPHSGPACDARAYLAVVDDRGVRLQVLHGRVRIVQIQQTLGIEGTLFVGVAVIGVRHEVMRHTMFLRRNRDKGGANALQLLQYPSCLRMNDSDHQSCALKDKNRRLGLYSAHFEAIPRAAILLKAHLVAWCQRHKLNFRGRDRVVAERTFDRLQVVGAYGNQRAASADVLVQFILCMHGREKAS